MTEDNPTIEAETSPGENGPMTDTINIDNVDVNHHKMDNTLIKDGLHQHKVVGSKQVSFKDIPGMPSPRKEKYGKLDGINPVEGISQYGISQSDEFNEKRTTR